MSVIQDFVGKFIQFYVKLCRDYGVSEEEIKNGLSGAPDAIKKLKLSEYEGADEILDAYAKEVDKIQTEKMVSLSDEEAKALKNIIDHAYDGTILTTNKPVTKAELDSLKKNIGSIKKKLK